MDTALVDNLLRFGQALRRCGLEGPAGRMADVIQAVEAVGIRSRVDLRSTLSTLLVHRREDLGRFDAVFDVFWRAREAGHAGPPLLSLGEPPRPVGNAAPSVSFEFEEDEPAGPSTRSRMAAGPYSAQEISRTKDFADFTDAEMARAAVLFDELGWRLGIRRTRRWVVAAHGPIDLRRVMSRRARQFGELIDLPRRQRAEKPRPIVVLADVSGSMERYSRMLLQFVYGITRGSHRVESFVFATRLTRVTRAAADRSRGRSVTRLMRSVQDWGGGTRIGEALRIFNVHWGRRIIRNGPVIVLISDGWDRGDPSALARELARVKRSSRRLIWLNPLLGMSNYEPLTRGMQAALPLVDDFLPAHNLESLEQLAAHLEALGVKRPSRARVYSRTASTAKNMAESGMDAD
jgi:uncharacterized protein with von Willebrand factor type A (vWA) domain